jgi:2-polyprenyl-3-methyl-5-hydroxy-6-metoxy-1,4-benzoquinol methylase
MVKQEEVLVYFDSWQLDEEAKRYLRLQSPRYAFLLEKVEKVIKSLKQRNSGTPLKILDIGPAFQTEFMRHKLKEVVINSIGFENIYFKPRDTEQHIQFDLNEAQNRANWPHIEKHHLVIMAGVIEHLYTYPAIILDCIYSWIEEKGFFIIQTPNAVRLKRRLGLLIGKNPQEMIRQDRNNPGHFREYTKEELIDLGKQEGLSLVEYSCHNYSGRAANIKGILYNTVSRLMPSDLRDDIYICFQKNS